MYHVLKTRGGVEDSSKYSCHRLYIESSCQASAALGLAKEFVSLIIQGLVRATAGLEV
jgi:hypothetical protein